ncbi:hypothetical protein SCUCBS95973_000007 [Sporothrix curviconia]|uniref:Stress-response A/B barrel domain-containing protein n=1 Tax=Sporothrix curviconia TaxID=1260050 RepID=A0ABP0AMU5_9PEZI
MAEPINRVTLFKIPNEEDQQRLASFYRDMPAKAVKDGKPYIHSVRAGPTKADTRNQGYTFAAISVFGSVQDMNYYDTECAAHQQLRAFAKTVSQGAMVVFFENAL